MTLSQRCVHVVDADATYRANIVNLIHTVHLTAIESATAEAFLAQYDPAVESCVVAEVRLPGMSGVALAADLAQRDIAPPIIFVTAHADVATAVQAMKAGAADFFQKPVEPQRLLDAVYRAFESSRDALERRRRREQCMRLIERLTRREHEVLVSLVRGQSNRVIAETLGIRERTVEAHRSGIMRKLEAHSIVDVVR